MKAFLQLGAPVGQNLEGLLDEDVRRAHADALNSELVAVRDLRDEDVVLCALIADTLTARRALAVVCDDIAAVLNLKDMAWADIDKRLLIGASRLLVNLNQWDKAIEGSADWRELRMVRAYALDSAAVAVDLLSGEDASDWDIIMERTDIAKDLALARKRHPDKMA